MMGIIASRKKWLDRLIFKDAKIWFIISLITLSYIVTAFIVVSKKPELVAKFQGGFNWRSLSLAFWEAITCVGLCYFLIMFFRKYLNRTSKMVSAMASDSYFVYFIHPVIVVGLTILSEVFVLSPVTKFLIVCILSIALCFLLAQYIRKIPVLSRVF